MEDTNSMEISRENLSSSEEIVMGPLEFLEENFPNIKSLEKSAYVLEDLIAHRHHLKNRITELDGQIKKNKDQVSKKLCDYAAEIEELERLGNNVLEKVDRSLVNNVSIETDVDRKREHELVLKIEGLKTSQNYITLVMQAQDLIKEITDGAMCANALQSSKVLEYMETLLALKSAIPTSATNLNDYVCENLGIQTKLIASNLLSQFEQVLDRLGWPDGVNMSSVGNSEPMLPVIGEPPKSFWSKLFKSKAPPVPTITRKSDRSVLPQFEQLFHDIVRIQRIMEKSGTQFQDILSVPGLSPILALDIMLLPLKKHFRFHFEGPRMTNRIDKPQWFFTWILNQLTNNEDFLLTIVQSLLDACGIPQYSAMNEFIRLFEILVSRKLRRVMPYLIAAPQNTGIFEHTVNEILLFERTLRDTYGYLSSEEEEEEETDYSIITPPPPNTTCLYELLAPIQSGRTDSGRVIDTSRTYADEWMGTELRYCMSRFQHIMTSSSAWQTRFSGSASDASDTKEAVSADSFVLLLGGVSDRYRYLPSKKLAVQFLESIQYALIDRYVGEIAAGEDAIELSPGSTAADVRLYARHANSAAYLASILDGWSSEIFFIQLREYIVKSRRANGEEENIGTVFENHVKTLYQLCEEMTTNLANSLFKVFKLATRQYRKRRNAFVPRLELPSSARQWTKSLRGDRAVSPSLSLIVTPEVASVLELTPELCEPLQLLAEKLNALESALSSTLFPNVWRPLAKQIDKYVVEDVISNKIFTLSGAVLFAFEIKTLFSIFHPYTARPEGYFRHSNEACILLALPFADAKVILACVEDIQSIGESGSANRDVLMSYGLGDLGWDQVSFLLSRRADLS